MMLLVALALFADSGIPYSAMPTIGQPPERCVPKDRRVRGKAESPSLRKLNELPDAEPQYTVLREINGCPIPAKVNAKSAKPR